MWEADGWSHYSFRSARPDNNLLIFYQRSHRSVEEPPLRAKERDNLLDFLFEVFSVREITGVLIKVRSRWGRATRLGKGQASASGAAHALPCLGPLCPRVVSDKHGRISCPWTQG